MVMAGSSDYFFTALTTGGRHSENLNQTFDVNSETVDMIVGYCYTGGIQLTIANVDNVLNGAKALQIESLIMNCCDMLGKELNSKNCIQFLEIADKHGLELLKDNSLAIISDELPFVNKLPEFYRLTSSQMRWLIKLLSANHEVFANLLDLICSAEKTFSIVNPGFYDSGTQSAFCAAVTN